MRWRFTDPADEPARRAALGRVDSFWRAFSARSSEIDDLLRGRARWDLPAFMASSLDRVEPGLAWDIAPGDRGSRRLVITPGARRALRPLVDVMVERAPAVESWQIVGHWPAGSVASADEAARALTGRGLEGVQAQATAGEHNDVDLLFTSPSSRGRDERQGQAMARMAARALLGDDLLDRWVATVESGPPGSASKPAPLEGLRARVESLAEDVTRSLPASPCLAQAGEARWSMFRRNPHRRAEYPGRSDLFVGTTMLPLLWRAAHGGRPFSSARFSRAGETFCYLKVDGEAGGGDGAFDDRRAIEEALSAALSPGRLGCVVGAGTGLRYGYVDLALAQLSPGLEACRRVLRDGITTRRAWLLFFDDALGDEWVGVHDDAPPPPGL